MPQIDLSLLVSTFQRPWHLRRVLESIARQENVNGRFEVIVTDDGSLDDTPHMVREFARSATFPIRMTTHAHDGFQLARCRNEGVHASVGEYLLFLDGDCLIPPNHLAIHLQRRRRSMVRGGHTANLDQQVSENMTLADVRNGQFLKVAPRSERRKLFSMGLKGMLYNLMRHPRRPKLYGGNIGVWRSDYERINGYDENFHGWGCEDDDLAIRLRMAGLQVCSINLWTCTYHLWHEPTQSKPQTYHEGTNYQYLNRADRVACCEVGLDRPRTGELAYELVVDTRQEPTSRRAA